MHLIIHLFFHIKGISNMGLGMGQNMELGMGLDIGWGMGLAIEPGMIADEARDGPGLGQGMGQGLGPYDYK